jgi:hypothetical protein
MAGGSIDFGGLGGAVSGLFGAFGDFAEAKAYKTASQLAMQNAVITEEATKLQETQANRQIFKTLGAQAAQVGGAGLAASGSAMDLLRSSAQQGALTKQLIQAQGLITQQGFEAESAQYQGMASAAKSAGTGGIFGSILKGIGAVIPFLSDASLKENIVKVGERPDGIGYFQYNWKGSPDTTYVGLVAQDVRRVRPEVVSIDDGGYLMVDYAALDEWPLVLRSV